MRVWKRQVINICIFINRALCVEKCCEKFVLSLDRAEKYGNKLEKYNVLF